MNMVENNQRAEAISYYKNILNTLKFAGQTAVTTAQGIKTAYDKAKTTATGFSDKAQGYFDMGKGYLNTANSYYD